MSKKLFLYLPLIFFANLSCKEIYHPHIKPVEKVLVVEALITDDPVLQYVKLSRAVHLDSTSYQPAQNADVYIKDNLNNYYRFKEAKPGYYLYIGSFKPVIGGKYQLFIKTSDKNEYSSSTHVFQPKGNIDSVYGGIKIKTFISKADKTRIYSNFEGVDLYGTIHSNNPYLFRFSTSMALEYFFCAGSCNFCWMKRNPNDYFILTNELNFSGEHQQTLVFLPTDLKYYGIYDEAVMIGDQLTLIRKHLQAIVLNIKQFSINQDVYDFYNHVNKQLQAQDRIYDPIAYNFSGNIKCLNNPDRPVFGVFELASVNSCTYVIFPPRDNIAIIKKFDSYDFNKIPNTNCYINSYPDFWVKY
jgi:hypothetical protein